MQLLQTNKYNYSLIINYLLIGYAFSLPISKAGTSLFEVLILLFWIFEGNWKYKLNQYKTNPLILSLTAFITYSLISVLWASSISYGLDYVSKYHHFLILAVIYTSLDGKFIKHIVSSFLIGMFLSEVMSYGIFFEIWSYKDILPSDPSPFMNHADYSIYLSFTIMILLNRIFFGYHIKYKILYLLFAISTTANLFINGGRTGQVTFIIVMLTLFILNMKNKLRAVILSILLLSIVFTTAYNFSPNFNNRFNLVTTDISRVINENTYKGSLSIRVSLWMVGLDHMRDSLPFGSGIGNEMNKVNQYSKTRDWNIVDLSNYGFHNMFITYAVQLGLIGLILFLSIFYFIFSLKFKNKQYRVITIIFLITFILWSFGGSTFHLMNPIVFFALFAGLLNKISSMEQKHIHI